MKITVQKSGGFSGVSRYSEMYSDDLPSHLKKTLTNLVGKNEGSLGSLKLVPKGAADYYSYKITLDDGSNQRVIECNEYDIQDNLKSLVTYVEKHKKNK
jgi:hypothetical protein